MHLDDEKKFISKKLMELINNINFKFKLPLFLLTAKLLVNNEQIWIDRSDGRTTQPAI